MKALLATDETGILQQSVIIIKSQQAPYEQYIKYNMMKNSQISSEILNYMNTLIKMEAGPGIEPRYTALQAGA